MCGLKHFHSLRTTHASGIMNVGQISYAGESTVRRMDSPPSGSERGHTDTDRSELAREVVADGDNPTLARSALASPVVQRPPVTSAQRYFSSVNGQSGSLGLAHERLNLSVTGLPPRVIESAKANCNFSMFSGRGVVFSARTFREGQSLLYR